MSALLPLLLAVFAAGALLCGAALPVLRTRFFERRLSLLIGFSAGLMLATALHELLPEALRLDHDGGIWGAGLGFLALYATERLTHFHACRHRQCEVEPAEVDLPVAHEHYDGHDSHHDHHHDHRHGVTTTALRPHVHAPVATHHHAHTDLMALAGMALHNFADGLTTAAAFTVSNTVGLVVILAIVLHQSAAGLSLGAIMMRAGRRRRRVLLSTALVASCILWGVLFYHLAVPLVSGIQGVVLGIAGGSFLYVAACDLLPEAHAEDEGWNVMAMTLLGYGFTLLVARLGE